MIRHSFLVLFLLCALMSTAAAQDLNTVRDDQIDRLKNYVVDAILPSGLVRDSVVLNGTSFHPATPDAAGFALVALSALDYLDKLPDAEQRVEQILSAYAGQNAGVAPDRSADGHFIHFMNIDTGAPAGGGWDASYTPIGTALLVAGAQFARNHFAGNATIELLTDQLTDSVNFNNAIHPSLDGRIFLDMTKAGGGGGGTVAPWNEFMLVESLALRETDNSRALAVKHRWLDTDYLPTISYAGIPTLTDNYSVFASGFWVQQMHFFNGDFRHSADFETFFTNQQQADQLYSANVLGEAFRYGLTAGLIPNGYHADRIGDHPFDVFSPEAVAAWGDMDTLLDFYNAQVFPTDDPRFKYGLLRVSGEQPGWIPPDAGLVDHLFLLFGLVESLDPDFFADRVIPGLAPGDYNADGIVDTADYDLWRSRFGSMTHFAADGNGDGKIDAGDYTIWRDHYAAGGGTIQEVPEPAGLPFLSGIAAIGWFMAAKKRGRRETLRGGSISRFSCGFGQWEKLAASVLARRETFRK